MLIDHHSAHYIIKAWQNFLNHLGFNAGGADGYWGPHTEAASKAFQNANHLKEDGLVGPSTISTAEAQGFALPKPEGFPPVGQSNTVFDVSHHNTSVDFQQAKDSGMQAVFYKVTQSTTFFDHRYYDGRKQAANQAGLLWGAYHFGAGGDGAAQADFFLEHAKPEKDTVLVLDLETDTTKGQTNMTLLEAKAFVQRIYDKTGQYPGIYGGSYLRGLVKTGADPMLSKCWLWIAEYRMEIELPIGWDNYTFWQYTDGKGGVDPQPVSGVSGYCDRSVFNGSPEDLTTFWNNHIV